MEVIVVLYFLIIPCGIICFFIGYLWLFRKCNIIGRLLASIVFGLALGYFSPCLFVIPATISYKIHEYKKANQDEAELKYFQAAIQGEYDEAKIREYYKSHPFPNMNCYKSSDLFDRSKMKISPKALQLLIEICDENPEIKGILATQPETPTELKMKIASSDDVKEVLPMAKDTKTPPEILILLAKHKSIDVSREVNRNSSAPLAAKYTYFIRYILIKDEAEQKQYKNENIIQPPDLETDEAKFFWNNLATDKHEYVRIWVAKYSSPSQILKMLGNDQSDEVLKWTFVNLYTPKETLVLIAKKFNSNINSLMDKYSRDPDCNIRRAVSQNRYTSNKVLFRLCKDNDSTVAGWATSNLEDRGYDDFSGDIPQKTNKPPAYIYLDHSRVL